MDYHKYKGQFIKVNRNSQGKIEPNITMIKNIATVLKRAQKFNSRDEFINEIKYDASRVTFRLTAHN